MSADGVHVSRAGLLEYFLQSAKPQDQWLVGMELEKMGRSATDGSALPYQGESASVRKVLEFVQARRGGDPVLEGDFLIGLDAPWGSISLEPGGQVEWSSRPAASLDELHSALDAHLATIRAAGRALNVRWLDEAVDPVNPVSAMPWMPKARYKIMRPYLGSRGRLAHRMMTQTASIQCAFDYADAEDWRRKFRASALLAPVATALFANSSALDGGPSGYRCYRQAIWRETDPARCGMPASVFDPGFDVEVWLDWVLDVPTIFRHRSRGLAPVGGVPFRVLLERGGCDAVRPEDWETHISTIFTEVRSYGYVEVRCADLQPDSLAFAVPAFWTGILYGSGGPDEAIALGAPFDGSARWAEGMAVAARAGLDGEVEGRSLRELAHRALELAARGLRADTPCVGTGGAGSRALEALAGRLRAS